MPTRKHVWSTSRFRQLYSRQPDALSALPSLNHMFSQPNVPSTVYPSPMFPQPYTQAQCSLSPMFPQPYTQATCSLSPIPKPNVPSALYPSHMFPQPYTQATCSLSPIPKPNVPSALYPSHMFPQPYTQATCSLSPIPKPNVPSALYPSHMFPQSYTQAQCSLSPTFPQPYTQVQCSLSPILRPCISSALCTFKNRFPQPYTSSPMFHQHIPSARRSFSPQPHVPSALCFLNHTFPRPSALSTIGSLNREFPPPYTPSPMYPQRHVPSALCSHVSYVPTCSLSPVTPALPSLNHMFPEPCTYVTSYVTCNIYVTCPIRQNTTLDFCYDNIPDAYKHVSLPPLGTSDHNTIHLIPAYRPKIQTEQVVKKDLKVWWCDSVEQPQCYFDCTDWDMLTLAIIFMMPLMSYLII